METLIESNEFIENAEFSGNLYGTSKSAIQDVLEEGWFYLYDWKN